LGSVKTPDDLREMWVSFKGIGLMLVYVQQEDCVGLSEELLHNTVAKGRETHPHLLGQYVVVIITIAACSSGTTV